MGGSDFGDDIDEDQHVKFNLVLGTRVTAKQSFVGLETALT